MNKKFLKDENGEDWDVGDTISLESTITERDVFSETDNNETVDSVNITIESFDSTIVNNKEMSFNTQGEYFYLWDTTGESPGDYKIIIDAAEGNINETEKYWIKLTD